MIKLPQSTEVNRILSKEKIVENLKLSTAQKTNLKNQIKKITITNEISPNSISLEEGKTVKAILIIEVKLKEREIDYKLLELLSKQNQMKMLFIIRGEGKVQLSLYYGKLHKKEWEDEDKISLSINGINLDEIWENIVKQIALKSEIPITNNQKSTPLEKQLENQEKYQNLKKQIDKLEKQARKEIQPKKKLELVGKIAKLKKEMEEI